VKTDYKNAESGWQAFIEGAVYPDEQTPWRDDPAFATVASFPGLRESIGGRTAPALTQAIGLVQALQKVDLMERIQTVTPALGLCLGFGMNGLEPYDVLHTFALDCVHGYEWIGIHVNEAAQVLAALPSEDPPLVGRIRLHHGTVSDLSAVADASVQVVYTANVFNREVPMSSETFERAMAEICRVLAVGGILLSRGSAGVLEEHLAPHGRWLLHTPLMAVFAKT
jgi:hypothetical protein